ncbi:MAG: MBL fold metallo-hydrolase, partial [Parachlamydia sp.]|nr:MBL fold metallo-hydrolase [Parachlamydia sp.]
MKSVFEVRAEGLYCKPGGFYIDAWEPVNHCIVTHAHSDHARFGHGLYQATPETCAILQHRLGPDCPLALLPYHQKIKMKDCWVSLHPAGHILGSAQVRIETEKGVSVVSGDYKRAADPTCEPFELVECDTFVTESTFGLPIYKWEPSEKIAYEIVDWWKENSSNGFASVLFCYALGKAQRLLGLLR